LYNADVAARGKPPAAAWIIELIAAADVLVPACPEYNYSISPALKNVIDRVSREAENSALGGKPVAILGVTGGMASSPGQYHLRQVCVAVNLYPLNSRIYSPTPSATVSTRAAI
jgi:chromate reductase